MTTKVYVDNLAASTTETDLTRMLSAYGNVMGDHIALDADSRQPRGFGFVTMVTSEAAQAAIQALNGETVPAGHLIVRQARPGEDQSGSVNGPRSPRRSASYLF